MRPKLAVSLILALFALVIAVPTGSGEEPGVFLSDEQAAEAAIHKILPNGPYPIPCRPLQEREWGEVCYSRTDYGWDTYAIFQAEIFPFADVMVWWVGVEAVEEGWQYYGGGGCAIWYCRIYDPVGVVLLGHPDGNAHCRLPVDARDATAVMQLAAGFSTYSGCSERGDVDVDGRLTARDALLILQAHAGMIPELPLDLGLHPSPP